MTTGSITFTDCEQVYPALDLIPMQGFNRIRVLGTINKGQLFIIFLAPDVESHEVPVTPIFKTTKIDSAVDFPFRQNGFVKFAVKRRPTENEDITCEGEIQFVLLS